MTTEQKTAGGIDWSYAHTDDVHNKVNSYYGKQVWGAFAPFIGEKTRVLEIGSGTGRICGLAAKYRSAEVVALDISEHSLNIARKLMDYLEVDATFILGDGLDVPLESGTFDVVLSEGVIEHFSLAEMEQIVSEHARMCRPGGTVLISVPNLLNIPHTYVKWRMKERFPAYPERSMTRFSLARLMKRHGLAPFAYSGFGVTASVEFFIYPTTKLRFLDRIFHSPAARSVLGFETLVAARRL